MPILARLLFVLLAHAVAASRLAGAPDAQDEDLATLARTLSAWISAETALAPPPEPRIVLVAKRELIRKVWGDRPAAGTRLTIESLYDRRAGIVYLRDDWDRADVVHRSHLVHELVHHFQHFHQVEAACGAALEPLAYALQVQWLAEHGISDGYGALGTDEATVRFLSICPGG